MSYNICLMHLDKNTIQLFILKEDVNSVFAYSRWM